MRDQHIASAQWITAMLVGFYIWWPIGLMILAAITLVALGQQVTGHRPVAPQLPQRRVVPKVRVMKTIEHTPYKAITHKGTRR